MSQRGMLGIVAVLVVLGAGCLAPREAIHVTIATETTSVDFVDATEILPGIYAPLPGEDARRAMYHRPAFFEVTNFSVTDDDGRRVRIDIVSNRIVDIEVHAEGGRVVARFPQQATHHLTFRDERLDAVREASYVVKATANGTSLGERYLAFQGPRLRVDSTPSVTCFAGYSVDFVISNTGDLAARIIDVRVAGYDMKTNYGEPAVVMPGRTILTKTSREAYESVSACEQSPSYEIHFAGGLRLAGTAHKA